MLKKIVNKALDEDEAHMQKSCLSMKDFKTGLYDSCILMNIVTILESMP